MIIVMCIGLFIVLMVQMIMLVAKGQDELVAWMMSLTVAALVLGAFVGLSIKDRGLRKEAAEAGAGKYVGVTDPATGKTEIEWVWTGIKLQEDPKKEQE